MQEAPVFIPAMHKIIKIKLIIIITAASSDPSPKACSGPPRDLFLGISGLTQDSVGKRPSLFSCLHLLPTTHFPRSLRHPELCLKLKNLLPDCPFVPQPTSPPSTYSGQEYNHRRKSWRSECYIGEKKDLSPGGLHMEAPKSQMLLASYSSLCPAEPVASLWGTAF